MMDERTSRIFIGLCLLVLVWIGVYWMWQPTREHTTPTITFEQPASEETQQPAETPPDEPAQPSIIDQTRISATPASEQTDRPPTTPSQTASPVLEPPRFFEHTVREGQTMQTIAEHYFGSRQHWSVIARANPFVDPQKLRAGMVLRIPEDPDNIQGRVVGKDTPPGVIVTHTPENDDETGVIEYVVRPGDSLSRISQRIYGSARHARFIYDHNRDKLRSMDDISIGQLLRLPPLPQEDGDSP